MNDLKETLLGFLLCMAFFGGLGLLACYAPICFLVVGGILFVFGLLGGGGGSGCPPTKPPWGDGDDGGL